MSESLAVWKVRPHGPLVRLAENLLWVSGDIPGMSLKRTMTVARLADRRLVIYSAIALGSTELAELEEFGKPAFLVVPNGGHRLDAPGYKERYPDIVVVAPKGSRDKVAEKVAVDMTYEEFPAATEVKLELLGGVGDAEGVMLVRSADGTSVVLNDVMFNMDTKKDILGWLFTTLFGSAPGPRVSRLAKWTLIKDRPALRADFERLAGIPDLVRVIVGHEKVASGPEAREALRTAATFL